ncbi:unnamed protein product [Diamesa hyperborea]
MAMPTCRNRNTGADVEVSLCNAASRPEPSVVQCNTHSCPPKWISDEWGPCSKVCGSGIKERLVVCAEESNGVKHRVPDEACRGVRPKIQEHCNVHECPRLELSEWSGCSSSCGTGMQVRSVECMDHHGHNTQCDPTLRPEPVQSCSTGISCTSDTTTITSDNSSPSHAISDKPKNSGRGSFNEHLDEDVTEEDEELQPQKPVKKVKLERPSDEEDDEEVEDDDEDLNMQGDAPENLQRNTPLAYQYRIPRAERLVDPNAPNEPTNSRGHQMMMDHHQHQHKYTMDPNNDEREEKDDPFASAKTSEEKLQILDESLSESLDFEYLVTPWSACSQTCGAKGSGYRLRSAHCMVRVKNATQNVDNVLCEDAGLRVPETVEKCGNIECPKWISSAWPPCTKSKCFAWHTALQKRDVNCIFNNESASIACDDNEKPIHQQECYNELCKGIWRVEAWSECNALCDRQGIKYRILQCVWYGTKKPAGNACKDNPRPAVMKKCNGPTCTTDSSDCRDILKYCKNVNKMGLCRLHRFQQQCCETCKFNVN